MQNRPKVDAGKWLERKLRAIARRHEGLPPAPFDIDKQVDAQPPQPRIALRPSIEAPVGTPSGEWVAARRNVAAGSAASTIALGSDVPSNFTMRRNGLMPSTR